MKKNLLLFITLFTFNLIKAQDFTGQWKGSFADKSTSFVGWGGEKCEYVLELECKGSNVTGYSYTYFNEGGYKYYTICKVKGKVNSAKKSVEVTETERTKTNIPYYIRNCFQIHKLAYVKRDDKEVLEGSWIPVPKQEGDCGYGSTSLSRRVLKQVKIGNDRQQARTNPQINNRQNTTGKTENRNRTNQTTTRVNRDTSKIAKIDTDPIKGKVNNDIVTKNTNNNKSFEQRNNNVLKTIEIKNETFKIELYDNGDIDGDTVSLFYNGSLLMSKKRLSAKAISIDLNVNNSKDVNELIMYAENLGEIPPNTALMIVTDGDKRYEVRITSDLQKSGVIRFVHKNN